MKEFELATKITTPLMLAALALCVLFGLLKGIAAIKKPSAAFKALIRWGFILALVLGVLANISYLVIASFGREVRLSGTVHDEKGQPVPLAIVDLGGKKGRAITDDYGEFELNIPGSRTANDYRLMVNAPDFLSKTVPVTGPRPKEQIEVTLARPAFLADDYAKLEATGWVRHYLGNPQVVLGVNFSNPELRKVTLENIFLTLTSPSGKPFPISLEGTYVSGGTMIPGTPPAIPLDKAQHFMIFCSFCNADQGMRAELSKAQIEVPYLNVMPRPDALTYSKNLADQLRVFMKSRMIWTPGEWRGQMRWSVDQKAYEQSFRFSLSVEDISRMSAITKYYEAGYGVYPPLNFTPVMEADPSTVIRVQK